MLQVEDSGIRVTWQRPLSPNGDLQYTVNLRQEDLATPGNLISLMAQNTTVEEVFFNIDVIPYYNYTADVSPFTGAGMGETTSGFVMTAEASK